MQVEETAKFSPYARQAIRRAWGCDCDGVSHLRPGRGDSALVHGFRHVVRKVSGGYVDECPFQSISDPLVREIREYYGDGEADHSRLRFLEPGDMDNRVLDGVAVWHRATRAARADRQEREMKEREKKS